MALLKYFKKAEKGCGLPSKFQANEHLTADDIELANKRIKLEIEKSETSKGRSVTYSAYSAKDRAKIGKYATEHGATSAANHFTKILQFSVPEPSARCFKNEYLRELIGAVESWKC